jgi:hypothetical protein
MSLKVFRRKSCLYPAPCVNLDRSHERLLRFYERLRKEFDGINRRNGTHVELVPYFILEL